MQRSTITVLALIGFLCISAHGLPARADCEGGDRGDERNLMLVVRPNLGGFARKVMGLPGNLVRLRRILDGMNKMAKKVHDTMELAYLKRFPAPLRGIPGNIARNPSDDELNWRFYKQKYNPPPRGIPGTVEINPSDAELAKKAKASKGARQDASGPTLSDIDQEPVNQSLAPSASAQPSTGSFRSLTSEELAGLDEGEEELPAFWSVRARKKVKPGKVEIHPSEEAINAQIKANEKELHNKKQAMQGKDDSGGGGAKADDSGGDDEDQGGELEDEESDIDKDAGPFSKLERDMKMTGAGSGGDDEDQGGELEDGDTDTDKDTEEAIEEANKEEESMWAAKAESGPGDEGQGGGQKNYQPYGAMTMEELIREEEEMEEMWAKEDWEKKQESKKGKKAESSDIDDFFKPEPLPEDELEKGLHEIVRAERDDMWVNEPEQEISSQPPAEFDGVALDKKLEFIKHIERLQIEYDLVQVLYKYNENLDLTPEARERLEQDWMRISRGGQDTPPFAGGAETALQFMNSLPPDKFEETANQLAALGDESRYEIGEKYGLSRQEVEEALKEDY
jgi:hypothetical protein